MENAPFHILLADDDADDRLIFIKAFSELRIKTVIHAVNDGVELMEYLSKKQAPLPHILFLDLNMPRKNGLECLKEIKSTEKLKDIPIAIYSTSASEKNIEETYINGANVYIKKPQDFSLLRQILDKAVMTAVQYQQPPFNKENFLLRV